jgi:hypothetical protein
MARPAKAKVPEPLAIWAPPLNILRGIRATVEFDPMGLIVGQVRLAFGLQP